VNPQKVSWAVTPAKAGVQKRSKRLDSRLRGNDRKSRIVTFYECINSDGFVGGGVRPGGCPPSAALASPRLLKGDQNIEGEMEAKP